VEQGYRMCEEMKTAILKWVVGEHTRERLVEYPFTFRHLEGEHILDIGSVDSLLPIGLTKLGYEVIGVDLRRLCKQPYFAFTLADAIRLPFKTECFDQSLSISTTEHVGLRGHGLEQQYPHYIEHGDGDRLNLLEMKRVTKQKGSVIITLPYGLGQHYWLRIYNPETLSKLLRNFTIEVQEFYKEAAPKQWTLCKEEEARGMVGYPLPKAVVCTKLRT